MLIVIHYAAAFKHNTNFLPTFVASLMPLLQKKLFLAKLLLSSKDVLIFFVTSDNEHQFKGFLTMSICSSNRSNLDCICQKFGGLVQQ